MLSKRSSGHIGSGGVRFEVKQTVPTQPQPQPTEQEQVETVFRQPRQKPKKLKFQRE
jgi:hypothetical protein